MNKLPPASKVILGTLIPCILVLLSLDTVEMIQTLDTMKNLLCDI